MSQGSSLTALRERGGQLLNQAAIWKTYAHVKEEINCEEQGQIGVKGIAYPITTYRVVGLNADAAATRDAIRTELPHLKLEVEPGLMSAEQREQAAAALRDALARLGQS